MSQRNQYKKFQFAPDCFFVKGDRKEYCDIANLLYAQIHTKHSINGDYTGTTRACLLNLIMDSGEEYDVFFDENKGFLDSFRDIGKDIDDIEKLYTHIASTTINSRYSKYVKQVENKGYFSYGDFKFYPRSKVVFDGKDFLVDECWFRKGKNYIIIKKKDHNFWDTVKQELGFTKIPQFGIRTDGDIILELFKKYMGWQWED